MANYSVGLEFPYTALEHFETEREEGNESGAECHKLIMVLSDGGMEYPEEIISVKTLVDSSGSSVLISLMTEFVAV